MNNFSTTTKPDEETLIEYYTSALYPNISMFVKREVNPSLAKTYEEADKVEDEIENINKHTTESKVNNFSGKKTSAANET